MFSLLNRSAVFSDSSNLLTNIQIQTKNKIQIYLFLVVCVLGSLSLSCTGDISTSNPPVQQVENNPTPEPIPVDGDNSADQTPLTSSEEQYFPSQSVWYQNIASAALDAKSAMIISALNSAGGWGTGAMRIDFSIEVLKADANTPQRSFIPTIDFFEGECDVSKVPIPAGGALEGENAYTCTQNGDCHLIVADFLAQRLYEMWRANIHDNNFYGGCLAVWDMSKNYSPSGRGEQCTSADAGGMPIAPLLFNADEVEEAIQSGGDLGHAIRFILPNSRIGGLAGGGSGKHFYVHPATHTTFPTNGGLNAIPYGAHLRLKSDAATNAKISALSTEGAKVVARTLQHYGMFLTDGGNIALTAQSDRFTAAKWPGLLDSYSLKTLLVTDFEMVEGGTRYPYTGDCVRNP